MSKQDFRVLKILPKDLNDFNDIEQIGDEFYFKKENNNIGENEIPEPLPTQPTQQQNTATTATTTKTTNLANRVTSASFPEPKNYVENSIEMNLIETTPSLVTFSMPNYVAEKINKTTEILTNIENDLSNSPTFKTSPTTSSVDYQEFNLTNDVDKFKTDESINSVRKMNEKIFIDKTVINEDFDEDESDEDFDYDEEYFEEIDRKKYGKYSSIVRGAMKNPLGHGFVMTPGYPKYYVGDSECKWIIHAPREQKIRLVVVDLSIRCKY